MSSKPVWAVARIDHFLEALYAAGDKQENPAALLVSITAVYEREADARQHEARLTATPDAQNVEYFVAATESLDGETDSPVVFVGIRHFRRGARLQKQQIVVGPVWPSLAVAKRAYGSQRTARGKQDVVGAFQTARFRLRRSTPPA